jgi:deoxyribose-phosphate aldolase
MKVLEDIISCIDLTTLEGADTDAKVIELCAKARKYNVAAVCVYPSFAGLVRKELKGSGIKTASVAGGFPAGQTSIQVKLSEINYALEEGAEELDVVISRGKLIERRDDEVLEEIRLMKEAAGDASLKVILETGELISPEFIRKASELALLGGADFLKTSTGKVSVGVTESSFLIMADTILEYLKSTSVPVGIKAAGGVRTPEQAIHYYSIVKSILGDDFLNADYFRIGASSLLDVLVVETGS